jgi:dTDP-4-dehydrorhamnose reductase
VTARWFIAGAAGMLGRDLAAVARAAGHEVTGADLPTLDILDPAQCHDQVAGHDVVVNCAAYTAVDAAESDEPAAFAVNATGAANLARAASAAGAAFVQVSTDYVFPGDATEPYPARAPLAPRSAYGRSKAAGEWAVRAECPRSWIVRTAWLYGEHGGGFPGTIRRLAATSEPLRVVADQVGQPTWTLDLADGILRIVAAGAPFGLWHGTGSGACSWFDFARAVLEELGLDPARVEPITTAELGRRAPRPRYGVLAQEMWPAAGLEPLPPWRDALRRATPRLVAGATR